MTTLRPIVAQIKGLAQEIKRTKASTKFSHHSLKQMALFDLKWRARHIMLAYAFIRRVPYFVVESKCNEKPSAFQLTRTITGLGISREWSHRYFPNSWEKEQEELNNEIKEWLNFLPMLQAKADASLAQETTSQSMIQGIVSKAKSIFGVL
jgi:hypothetical protein